MFTDGSNVPRLDESDRATVRATTCPRNQAESSIFATQAVFRTPRTGGKHRDTEDIYDVSKEQRTSAKRTYSFWKAL
eukprot:g78175.t1